MKVEEVGSLTILEYYPVLDKFKQHQPGRRIHEKGTVPLREREREREMSREFSSVLFTTTSGGGASVADFKLHHLPTCRAARPSPSVSVSVSFSAPTASFGRSFSRRGNSSSCVVCRASKAVDEVKEVTESGWQSLVIGCETPVLVEFWAPWCGPCRMIAPVVDELAKEYAGKIRCYKLNTDESPNVAKDYGIRSIPTVLFFKDGERKENIIGAVPKSTLAAMIEKYLEA